MATTSLWRIKGTVQDVIAYAENPDKTTEPHASGEPLELSLSSVIGYAVNQVKTADMSPETEEPVRQFVTGINCFPETAPQEMLAVKQHFGKEDGTVGYHGYQSFAEGEVTPEQAHEIGVRLAKQLWGQRYQVVVATHLDKASHLHNHFVINTVSFIDGKKFYRSKKDYQAMRDASDALCREYGLSVVAAKGRGKNYGEWQADKEGKPTWRQLIKADIDAAIEAAQTDRQFFLLLEKQGYEIKVGQDISVKPPGKPRFVRLARSFGEDYTIYAIRRRILQHSVRGLQGRRALGGSSVPIPCRRYHQRKKAKGLRAKYYYYCYRLGYFKKKPSRKQKLPPSVREDILDLSKITRATILLHDNNISTLDELLGHKASLVQQLDGIATQRQALYRAMRTAAVKDSPDAAAAIKAQLAALSARARGLRAEIHTCDDTASRSQVVTENINTLRDLDRRGTDRQRKTDDRRR